MNRRLTLTLLAIAIVVAACETTGNIDPKQLTGESRQTGVVLLTVTHDQGPTMPVTGKPSGQDARFYFEVRGTALGKETIRVFSLTESLAPVMTSDFGEVWGRYFVRDLAPGSYEVFNWMMVINTGVGTRTISPKSPPVPLRFEVRPNEVTYIGNLHGRVQFGTFLGLPISTSGFPEVRDESERDLKIILKAYPQLEGRVLIRPLPKISPWIQD